MTIPYLRGGDWGSYLFWDGSLQMDFKTLAEKAGLGWFSHKGNQNFPDAGYSTLQNLAESRRHIPINGCYYWHHPTWDPRYLLDLHCKQIDLENPDFIHLDIEEGVHSGERIDPNRISDTAQLICEGFRTRYAPKPVDIYSRKDFILGYAPGIAKWAPAFGGGWWASWMDYGLQVYRLTWDQIKNLWNKAYPDGRLVQITEGMNPLQPDGWPVWTMWQDSSRVMPPADQEVQFDHQYDWDLFNGSLAEMRAWANLGTDPGDTLPPVEKPMIYNPLVPMDQRAFGNLWTAADASAKSADVFNQVDFAFVQMGGKSDIDKTPVMIEESGWTARLASLKAAGKPVVGQLEISADWYIRKETNKGIVDGWTFIENPFALQLMKLWRTNPVYTWGSVTAADGGWRPLGGLSFLIWETRSYTVSDIPGVWQVSTLKFIEQLHVLMEAGKVPSIPVMVTCSPDFAAIPEVTTWLNERAGWLYLVLNQAAPPTQPAAHFASLGEFSAANRPANSVTFKSVPGNLVNRVLFHLYCNEYAIPITCAQIVTSSGLPRPVNALLGNDTPAVIGKLLGGSVVVPPPAEDWQVRALAAEGKLAAIKALL